MNTDQIAAEAFQKMKAAAWTNAVSDDAFVAIIKAAIDKVDEQWRERFRMFEKIEAKFGPASQRAAQASSTVKDWTVRMGDEQDASEVKAEDTVS